MEILRAAAGEIEDCRQEDATERYISAKRIEGTYLVRMVGNLFIPMAQRALARMKAAQTPKVARQPKDVVDQTCENLYGVPVAGTNERAALKKHLVFEGTDMFKYHGAVNPNKQFEETKKP